MEKIEKSTGLLRELQLKSLEILKKIHIFCIENEIKYSLIAGSIIGAIVHKGIIPWDDDIDIAMDRKNFEKFRELAIEKLPAPLRYTDFFIDNSHHVLLGRILDDSTTCVAKDQYGRIRIGGIFIDITVYDTVPSNMIMRKRQYFNSLLALLLVNNKVPENHGELVRKVCGCILSYYAGEKRVTKVQKLVDSIKSYSPDSGSKLAEVIYFRGNKILFDEDMFDEFILVDFEDTKIPVIKKYDYYIRKRYNRDYTILPPVQERKAHRDIQYLDFQMGYRDYIKNGKGYASGEFSCED